MNELLILLLLGAVNHQVSHIVTASALFNGVRAWFGERSPYLGYLLSCHLCFGTWVGLIQAVFVQVPIIVDAPPLVGYLSTAFAAALLGRIINEFMALFAAENELREFRIEQAAFFHRAEVEEYQRRQFERFHADLKNTEEALEAFKATHNIVKADDALIARESK